MMKAIGTDFVRILVVGDFHYPDRATLSKEEVLSLSRYSPKIVVGTGDYTSEDVIYWLSSFGVEHYFVKGNMDYLDLPVIEKFRVYDYKIGVFHGHGIRPRGDVNQLIRIMEKEDLDILLTGHTHRPFMANLDGLFIFNPGSFTGAYSGEGDISYRSYLILDIYEDGRIEPHFFIKKKE